MKSGRLGFGLFILTIGIAWLATSLGWQPSCWSDILPYWPVVLILWGVAIMVRQPVARGIALAAAAIFAAIWFVSWFDPVTPDGASSEQTLAVPADSTVTTGELKFDSGAGEFTINSAVTGSELTAVDSQATRGQYRLDQTVVGSKLDARVWYDAPRGMMMGMRGWHNEVAVSLNPQIVWQLEANVGAADFTLDAEELSLDRAVISAGAANISLRLGDQSKESKITVKAGASDINIAVPTGLGVRVELATGLTGHDLADLKETGENVWESTDYDTAEKKIDLRLEAGVSDIQLERY